MACAALASLLQTIDQIINHHDTPITLPPSVGKKACSPLTSLLKTIYQTLSHHRAPIAPPPIHHETIRSIRDNVVELQSLLINFPQINSSLQGQIREVAYAAEDVIEYLLCEGNPSDCRESKSEFEHKLKEVAEEFMSIAGYVADYVRNNGSVDNEQRLSDLPPDISYIPRRGRIRTDVVVGFIGEIHRVKRRLTDVSSPSLQVIPIIGKGGIGKTTIASRLYHDLKITDRFEVRGWVTVSQDYSVGSIVLNLLASMKEIQAHRDVQSNIPMEDQIHKCLKGMRYLIVIDDIWSNKAWDDLRKLFPHDNIGSRIVLTTRLRGVARYADTSNNDPVEVNLLNEKESLSLLQKKTFGYDDFPRELGVYPRLIAQRCEGLPLLILMVAGLLSKIDKLSIWKQIGENDEKPKDIMSLCYIHLPHHLKSCFLYMGGFPEDYSINVSELIKLWVAEGFYKMHGPI